MYNEIEKNLNNKGHLTKENVKFSTVEIYIADEIFDEVKRDANIENLPESSLFIDEMERIFLFKKHKVILKIGFEDFNQMADIELKYRAVQTGNNVVAIIENDIPPEILDNFFSKYTDHISYRKVMNGSIKENYLHICKLIFFNSKLYKYDLETGTLKFNRKQKQEEEETNEIQN